MSSFLHFIFSVICSFTVHDFYACRLLGLPNGASFDSAHSRFDPGNWLNLDVKVSFKTYTEIFRKYLPRQAYPSGRTV